MGTPKTMKEAIANALDEICTLKKNYPFLPSDVQCDVIKKHVVDFLAQAFNVALFGSADNTKEERTIMDLFFRVSGRQDRAA